MSAPLYDREAEARAERAERICDAREDAAMVEQWEAMSDPIQEAIDAFNARGETEDFYGHTSRVYARRPILATDCDYEIVRMAGLTYRKGRQA